jgi:hypothetical protein
MVSEGQGADTQVVLGGSKSAVSKLIIKPPKFGEGLRVAGEVAELLGVPVVIETVPAWAAKVVSNMDADSSAYNFIVFSVSSS